MTIGFEKFAQSCLSARQWRRSRPDEFEFIELINNLAPALHEDLTSFLKSVGITKAYCSGAVTCDEFGCCACSAPTLACIRESGHRSQGQAVVDNADMRRPGPLKNVRSPIHNSFAEQLWR